MQRNKICVLKLGGKCNLNCKFCHSQKKEFQFNPDIIPYLKNNGFFRITFSGGEPLEYWDLIKKICSELGKDFQYKFVSNLTLLREDMIPFLNEYHFAVYGSYDGEDSCRDQFPRPRFDLLSKINKHGFSVTVYEENNNLRKLKKDIDFLVFRNRLHPYTSLTPNFIHQTSLVPGNKTSLDTVKNYIQQLAPLIETELIAFMRTPVLDCLKDYPLLYKSVVDWWLTKEYKGIKCANENIVPMTIEGNFMACPYRYEYIGNIYTGFNWEKLDSLVPAKCKVCPIKNICKASCWTNITNQECYLARTMNKWLNKVIEKWDAEDKLLKAIEERRKHIMEIPNEV